MWCFSYFTELVKASQGRVMSTLFAFWSSHTHKDGQKRMILLLTQSNKIDLTHTKMVKNYAEADCAGMGLVRGLRNLTVMVKLVKYNWFWTQRHKDGYKRMMQIEHCMGFTTLWKQDRFNTNINPWLQKLLKTKAFGHELSCECIICIA